MNTVIWTIVISIFASSGDGEVKRVDVSFEGWYKTRALCYADTAMKRTMLDKILGKGAIKEVPRGEGVTITMEPICYKQPVAVV